MLPKEELALRLKSFQKLLQEAGLEGALLTQDIDLYYLSGTSQEGHLYVPQEGEPILMVRRVWEKALASPLPRKVPLKSLKEIPAVLRENGYSLPATLGLELDVLPAQQYLRYRELFPQAQIKDAGLLIRKARMIKTPFELALICKAAESHARFFAKVPAHLKEGKSEWEITQELLFALGKEGHVGTTFSRSYQARGFLGLIVLTGESGSVPAKQQFPLGGPGISPLFSEGPGKKPLKRAEPVIVDAAGCYAGYHVDATRVYVLGGKLPAEIEKGYAVALAIQEKIQEEARPGVSCRTLYNLAREMAAKAGLEENFQGYGENRVPFVGHGVGLELDELPVVTNWEVALKEGMVIAFEFKFVFPGKGAVGIENTFLVTAKGLEKLTAFPEEIHRL